MTLHYLLLCFWHLFLDLHLTNATGLIRADETLLTQKIDTLPSFEKMELTSLIQTSYNVAFYVGLSPFCIVREKTIPVKFSIKTWWPQKIICGLLSLLCNLWILRDVRLRIPSVEEVHNPKAYFRFIFTVLSGGTKWLMMKQFWLNQQDIISILGFLSTSSFHGNLPEINRYKFWLKPCTIRLICIMNIVVALAMCITGLGFDFSDGTRLNMTIFELLAAKVEEATRHAYFMETTSIPEPTLLNSIFTIFGAVCYIHRRMLGMVGDFLVLVSVLILMILVRSFVDNTLKYKCEFFKTGKIIWNQIDREHAALLEVADATNKLIGTRILLYVFSTCVFYSTTMDELIMFWITKPGRDTFIRFHEIKNVAWLLVIIAMSTFMLWMAAEVNSQVRLVESKKQGLI